VGTYKPEPNYSGGWDYATPLSSQGEARAAAEAVFTSSFAMDSSSDRCVCNQVEGFSQVYVDGYDGWGVWFGDQFMNAGSAYDNRNFRSRYICRRTQSNNPCSGQADGSLYITYRVILQASCRGVDSMTGVGSGYDLTEGSLACSPVGSRPRFERVVGQCQPSAPSVGNPVEPFSGNKTQTEASYVSPDRLLTYRRTYNSRFQEMRVEPFLGLSQVRLPFWVPSFSQRVYGTGRDPELVTVARDDGKLEMFRFSSGVATPINPDPSGELRPTMSGPTVIGWTFKDRLANTIETYDEKGRLLTIQGADGSSVSLTYQTPAGQKYPATAPNCAFDSGLPAASRLVCISSQRGQQLRLRYVDASDNPVELVYPSGDIEAWSWGPAGSSYTGIDRFVATNTRFPDGAERIYHYEESAIPGHLTGVSERPAGGSPVRVATFAYSDVWRNGAYGYLSGSANSTERAGGALHYSVGTVTSSSATVVDPIGSSRTYTYAVIGEQIRLTSVSQPGGSGCGPAAAAISYDASANVSSRTDFNGVKTCYAYDLGRNLETKRVEGVAAGADCATALTSPPSGSRVISTQWHPDWRFETKIAEPNKITTVTYNGQGATCAPSTVLVDGKPPAVVCSKSERATTDSTGSLGFSAGLSGSARTWSYTYTTFGRVLTATDPNGKVTTTTYYADDDPDLGRRGNVATVTNAADHVTRISAYNLHGQPTQIVDPNGLVTDLTYDLRMRLTSRKVGNELTTFGYDPVGQLTSVTLPDGAAVTYSYDAAHRLTAIADQAGNRIDYVLDAMGNRVTEKATDNGGTLVRNIQRTIDALNRVQQVTGTQ
jgi:YD repeat-containing protein